MSCGGGSGWLGQHRFMWAEAPSVLGQTEKRVDRKGREEERLAEWVGLGLGFAKTASTRLVETSRWPAESRKEGEREAD